MAQLDPSRYKRLSTGMAYGQSDGTYWDGTASQLVIVMGDAIVARIDANGIAADLEVTSEARGDILRRGASAWERHAAKAAGQILVGDGTDIASVALSGDAALSGAGALTLSQALLQKGSASFAKAAIIGTSAGQLGHADGGAVIAAPAAGYALEFVSGIVILDYATAAYTGGGNVSFNYAGGGGALSGVVSFANSIGGSADKVAIVLPAVPTNNQLVAATGINLVVAAAPTDPGTAAGSVTAICCYRRHTTGL